MDVSLGFVAILFLILFPGLIYRRLYYYGEFSKQFNTGQNLIWPISLSILPGIVILSCVYWFYDSFLTEIDLDCIIDKFKDISNPEIRMEASKGFSLDVLMDAKVAPFMGFLYSVSIILGAISGRFVRISGIDTRFKLFRFKNYWFYLFNGRHTSFKKMKHLKEKEKKHLFTKADILIDSSSRTDLYSGIIVDYELDSSNSTVLSKVMLQNAERYSIREDKRVRVSILGQILVVDCSSMKNINLTYIYEDVTDIPSGVFKGVKGIPDFFRKVKQFFNSLLKTRVPNRFEVTFGFIILLLIPFFFFQADGVEWEPYRAYFKLTWYVKIIIYLTSIQAISFLNPFVKEKEEYKYVNIKTIIFKLAWIGLMMLLLWLMI